VEFEAHKEGVDKLLVVKENAVVLSTSGGEKKVKLWDMEGQLNGAIDFCTFKKTAWRVAEMNFYKKLQAIDTTIYSMKLIENKKLTPEEEEFIKVNMLINEYMNAEEKEEYLKWVTLLKRGRGTRRQQLRKRPHRRSTEDHPDVRDAIEQQQATNDHSEEPAEPNAPVDAEFDQIYSKLVAKIKTRLDRSELPAISSRKQSGSSEEKAPAKPKEVNINEFLSTLRQTLHSHQHHEEERKLEQQFTAVMSKKSKGSKRGTNMLYQSLVEVRRNIQTLERKQHHRSRKLL
jgi:hypothetical protein